MTGSTNSPDFPLTADALDKNLSSLNTSYPTVLAADGGFISYFTLLSGESLGIGLDGQGNP